MIEYTTLEISRLTGVSHQNVQKSFEKAGFNLVNPHSTLVVLKGWMLNPRLKEKEKVQGLIDLIESQLNPVNQPLNQLNPEVNLGQSSLIQLNPVLNLRDKLNQKGEKLMVWTDASIILFCAYFFFLAIEAVMVTQLLVTVNDTLSSIPTWILVFGALGGAFIAQVNLRRLVARWETDWEDLSNWFFFLTTLTLSELRMFHGFDGNVWEGVLLGVVGFITPFMLTILGKAVICRFREFEKKCES